MEDPRLVGFGVQGFRDVRTKIFVGPLERLNILGGVNNSGKSAILAALEKYFPTGDNRNGGMRAVPSLSALEALDVPQVESDPFSVGLAIDFGPGNIVQLLLEVATGRKVRPDNQGYRELETVLNNQALLQPDTPQDSNVRWFWLKVGAGGELADDFLKSIESEPVAPSALRYATSTGYSGTISWSGLFWKAIARSIGGPQKVVLIPPGRRISSTNHRDMTLPSADGGGFPGMLLSMLAPTAEQFKQARERLAILNGFLRDVLGRPTAELLVPHNAQTVHVALEDRVLPLSHLGAGIEQVVVLAAICTEYRETLILLEEPDLYLHPTLQRQLLRHLLDKTSNTYVMATHSAALLDTDYANVFRVDWSADNGTSIDLVSGPQDRASLAIALGFRASDLVQANAVIWVEGPSDRIYIKHWLALIDKRLVEGIHFTFVMYGGRLAEHLTAVDEDQGKITEGQMSRFLNITRINRHSVFVMDSDLGVDAHVLDGYKTRLRGEFSAENGGFVWITDGVMIENYLEPSEFKAAYSSIHTRKPTPYEGDLRQSPFAGGVKQPDKVGIAEKVVADGVAVPQRGDLQRKLQHLAGYLRRVNGISN
ncbi:AAA family ATPase [Kribbella sp. NPDC049174]|uniref:AAA family ATPase n=1 Tax=Kribbella sp. NPDC049174 TaxID=3364112 RepID=UPI00371C3576